MAVEDLLRLAWQADRDGRAGRRDALLTLAAAEAPPDAPWLVRCRRRIVRGRPDHPFAAFTTVADAMAEPRIRGGIARLREQYPPGRVVALLRRDAVRRGPWTGREPSLSVVLSDLFPATEARPSLGRVAGIAPRGVAAQAASKLDRSRDNRPAPAAASGGSTARFYLEVLTGIALLLSQVLDESGRGTRAA